LFLGSLAAVVAVVYGTVLVFCRFLGIGFLGGPVVIGYTSTIVSILLLGGVQLICVGLLGEYIGRIYDEVKRRPLFLIHRVHAAEAKLTSEEVVPLKAMEHAAGKRDAA
jgi:dolichol-phosphate mannosyltransferase